MMENQPSFMETLTKERKKRTTAAKIAQMLKKTFLGESVVGEDNNIRDKWEVVFEQRHPDLYEVYKSQVLEQDVSAEVKEKLDLYDTLRLISQETMENAKKSINLIPVTVKNEEDKTEQFQVRVIGAEFKLGTDELMSEETVLVIYNNGGGGATEQGKKRPDQNYLSSYVDIIEKGFADMFALEALEKLLQTGKVPRFVFVEPYMLDNLPVRESISFEEDAEVLLKALTEFLEKNKIQYKDLSRVDIWGGSEGAAIAPETAALVEKMIKDNKLEVPKNAKRLLLLNLMGLAPTYSGEELDPGTLSRQFGIRWVKEMLRTMQGKNLIDSAQLQKAIQHANRVGETLGFAPEEQQHLTPIQTSLKELFFTTASFSQTIMRYLGPLLSLDPVERKRAQHQLAKYVVQSEKWTDGSLSEWKVQAAVPGTDETAISLHEVADIPADTSVTTMQKPEESVVAEANLKNTFLESIQVAGFSLQAFLLGNHESHSHSTASGLQQILPFWGMMFKE